MATIHRLPRRDPAYEMRRPREIASIGSTLIGVSREGLDAKEARRRLIACGMSEIGADVLIESAGRNLTRKV